jgi:hypothetical protein
MSRNAITMILAAAALSGCATYTPPAPTTRASIAVGPTPAQCQMAHIQALASARAMTEALPACERNVGLNAACQRVVTLANLGLPAMELSGRCGELLMPPPNVDEAVAIIAPLGPRMKRLAARIGALQ